MKVKNALMLAGAMLLSPTITLATESTDNSVQVKELTDGLSHPWGMVQLPNGDFIINERPGTMRRFSQGTLGEPITGVPEVVAQNQGGLLGITADPDFASNNTLYFCYSSPGEGGAASTVAKAELKGNSLSNVKTIFTASPRIDTGFHFGCRVVIDGEGYLFISLGDRGSQRDQAQNTDNHIGTVVRIKTDGVVPADNPFVSGAAPQVFTYGHRNVQGMTVHPVSGQVWTNEHGPKGGDEVNILEKGNNYGWPVITYGVNYNDTPVSDLTEKEGMQQPFLHWTPSIAPSGMDFYDGDAFTEWKGDLLVGSLKFDHLRRVELDDNNNVVAQHELLRDRGERIRDVIVGQDGLIYLLTDEPNGKLLQVSPK
ncbi:PQQ-dependent sugar dehydrogenase [Alteromonas facilis]|uniref:PQQ-dependent sugar dehydrogenase n=1 Tax=Alteromonas facilis TaxID=2048004 RepID=UPI000C28D220|nr:PQQ-dependent sugar dehydrogenase [Alteromonas facilis]